MRSGGLARGGGLGWVREGLVRGWRGVRGK